MIDFESAPTSGAKKSGWPENVVPFRRNDPQSPSPNEGAMQAAAFHPGSQAGGDAPEPDYLSSLNERQREAVLTTEGPLIVLAGAGSGKTKMLTSRIAHLIEGLGVAPYQILAVTFTNKAAAEMRERVERHLKHSASLGSPEIGTFHSVCVRLLRRELAHTPFTQPFVIYDDSDQLSLLKTVVAKLGIDEKNFSPKAFQAAINRAKCDALEPHEIQPSPHNFFEKQMVRVYEQYQKDLFANNAIDFGEIICLTYRLLRDNLEARARYHHRFRYIHVDEYQDTNRAQYLLLSMMAGKPAGGHQNICVVGDEDQSIYKWRGADIRNILDFEKDYPGAKVVKLEQNYRSTRTIITAASEVIRNNKERKDKTLWTENQEGTLIIRAQLPDERAEAEMVIAEIKRLATYEDRTYNDFAIFYRTHAQSRQFEDVFRREKIPYQIVGGLRFYDRKEIKDVLSYFKVILNPSDSVSMKRIMNVPARGIGKTTLDKLDQLHNRLSDEGKTYWDALQIAAVDSSITNAGTARKLAHFVGIIQKLMAQQPKLLVTELYHLVLDETNYVVELKKEGTEESLARIENLEEFDTLLQEFEEDFFLNTPEAERDAKKAELLPMFLEQSSLASDVDSKAPLQNAVKLMTLHSSKGLEYPVVFLPGMEEGLFPSVRSWEQESEEDIEEERRLCYVGMTRARENLYLSHVVVRRLWGNVTYQEPARFFTEIPAELVDFKDLTHGSASARFKMSPTSSSGSSYGSGSSYSSGSSSYGAGRTSRPASPRSRSRDDDFSQVVPEPSYSSASALSSQVIGLKFQHPDYGPGTIVSSEGSGNEQKVVVEFKGKERKKFLLRYLKQLLSDGDL